MKTADYYLVCIIAQRFYDRVFAVLLLCESIIFFIYQSLLEYELDVMCNRILVQYYDPKLLIEHRACSNALTQFEVEK